MKKQFTPIRQPMAISQELASMTLDMYYKRHVQKTEARRRNMKPSKKCLHCFQRTHFFGPNYWARKPPVLTEQTNRVDSLRKQIREVKATIEYKSQVDLQQRLLEQLKADLAKQEAQVESTDPPVEDEHQPLVLMIDDEVIYDEEYTRDPIWK
ncbi:uncharacterized protein [Drosophila kikkawai]|uniref:Uncharacterized protein n=1 Tax=Drosophila kikkawai TaxID=30033 RepID=A0A6P4J794_DROKI|nr:uncharacterized protein LOC108080280 [Drosophila kikkawai]